MEQGSDNQIIGVVENKNVEAKFLNLLANQKCQVVFTNLDNALECVQKQEAFCIVFDMESLAHINDDKFDFLLSIRQQNSTIGIIILSDDLQDSDVRKLLPIENLLVISPSSADFVSVYDIVTFFKMLHNIDVNVSVSKFICSEKKIYHIPNDLLVVKPITEHLIRDLVCMGIIGYDRLYNVKFGVQEMLINAIEHGNLEISYDEKSNLLNNGASIGQIISERANLDKNRDKFVEVEYYITQDYAKYVIRDQGKGFDWKSIPAEITADNFDLIHGRGILMSKKAFDEFSYNDAGNEVTMVVRRQK